MNKIICGDGIEFLKTLPSQSCTIITDPPYGIGLKYDTYDDSEANWEKLFSELVKINFNVATMMVLPCCRIAKLSWIYKTAPPDWLICWYKGSPGHRSYIGFNDWEPMLVYGKNKGVCMHDYFHVQNNEKMGNYGHPCPKPLAWAEWLISRATRPGDLVVDPFCGSGTVGVACKKLNRNFIGVDISQKYCDIAKERIKSVAI